MKHARTIQLRLPKRRRQIPLFRCKVLHRAEKSGEERYIKKIIIIIKLIDYLKLTACKPKTSYTRTAELVKKPTKPKLKTSDKMAPTILAMVY